MTIVYDSHIVKPSVLMYFVEFDSEIDGMYFDIIGMFNVFTYDDLDVLCLLFSTKTSFLYDDDLYEYH